MMFYLSTKCRAAGFSILLHAGHGMICAQSCNVTSIPAKF